MGVNLKKNKTWKIRWSVIIGREFLKYVNAPVKVVSFNKKPFRKFKNRERPISIEDKIKNFVLRNSKNGYYTKVSTLPQKFEISDDKVWQIVGELLDEGKIESTHDEKSGEMKLCEFGKTYLILNLDRQRKRQRNKEYKKNKK